MSTAAEGRTRDFLQRADLALFSESAARRKRGPQSHSLVELNLQGYKRLVRRQDLDRNDLVCRNDRNGRACRIRFKSRTDQLEISDALLKLDAYRAPVAAALVVGLMRNIRR